MKTYSPKDIEPKWQSYWLDHKTFKTDDSDRQKPKFYVLDMFPYPSGAGLHVGHPEGYTATDIVARYKRSKGFNVLHPIGWDAFGLPAEQYAIKTGTHPAVTTQKNIERFREQLQAIGFSYDWDREVNTTDPAYFKWTQWIFLQLFKKGLAYQHEAPVNWCPELGTVLANEEVIDGKSEVGGYPVIRKPMRQWMLKITAYADRLLDDLELVDWPDSIKEMQRNWIGKSTGATIHFAIEAHEATIEVFTTRPDTIFGATYMVLAPEHELVTGITHPENASEVEAYVAQAAAKSEVDRQDESKAKTGVFTGAYAINPASEERIPIWIADYVLAGYGTGAIMAVPAHDDRDYEFARQFDLSIREVVSGGDITQEAYTGQGTLVNSANDEINLNGLAVDEAKKQIIAWLEKHKKGRKSTNYKLRDWLFSRQRYWGEPFPLIHVNGHAKALPENALPITLPEVADFKPTGTGEPPLAKAEEWLHLADPETGQPAKRETNTMPQWAGSCWYYLRYIDPNYELGPVDPDKEKYWMPVDLYVGGAEHAVLHLLYARFWHKVLYDCGVVSTKEPFHKLVNQGMILGEMEFTGFQNGKREWISVDQADEQNQRVKLLGEDVEKLGQQFVVKGTQIAVEAKAHKMSKSRGNVINPDEVIALYGADSLRLYEMFMGPLEQVKPWSMKGVEGVYRFLNRVWRLFVDETEGGLHAAISEHEPTKEQSKALHETIKKVSDDIENMRFNTAISAMMIFVNQANKWDALPKSTLATFLQLLSPFSPHLAEELWEMIGRKSSIGEEPWPEVNPEFLKADTHTYAIQVNGKVRGEIEVKAEHATDKEFVLGKAKKVDSVAKYVEAGTLVKEIFVPKKIINLVVK